MQCAKLLLWEWGRAWAAAQENKEWEGYRRWEEKGQKVETGPQSEKKYKTLIFVMYLMHSYYTFKN